MTNDKIKTPSYVQPSAKLLEEIDLNRKVKKTLDHSEDSLLQLSNNLVDAELFKREQKIQKSLDQYKIISDQFETQLEDYETASYFYKRCLDISQEEKSLPGEANAYMGLGICEEKVFNIDMARENLETALEKAIESRLDKIVPRVQLNLIRVYKIIAEQALDEQEDYEKSLEFFNKCLNVSKDAN